MLSSNHAENNFSPNEFSVIVKIKNFHWMRDSTNKGKVKNFKSCVFIQCEIK